MYRSTRRKNYNSQLTGQEGIHRVWDSRVPELLSKDYSFWVGKAEYIESPQTRIWEMLAAAISKLVACCRLKKMLTQRFSSDKKFSFEEKIILTVRVYSREFTEAFANELDGQIERQLRKSIKLVSDFWYTAWIQTGQPDLHALTGDEPEAEDFTVKVKKKLRENQ